MFKTLRAKFLFHIIFTLSVGVSILYFAITGSYEGIIKENLKEDVNSISTFAFKNIRTAMDTGDYEIIKTFITNIKNLKSIENIEVYRSAKIDELFKKREALVMDSYAREAFENKKRFTISKNEDAFQYRAIKPLIAEKSCLTCHTNANKGEVLGVMDITLDLSNMADAIANSKIKVFLIFIILAVLIIVAFIIFFNKEIVTSIELVKDAIRGISDNNGRKIENKNLIRNF